FVYSVCDDGTPVLCDTATVIITVFPAQNNPPVAQIDTLIYDGTNAVNGDVLVNNGNGVDSDPDGDNITVTATPITNPVNGTVTLNTNGTFTWIPNGGFTITGLLPGAVIDSFNYSICDDGTPVLCDTATVYIVLPLGNNPPVAITDLVTGTIGNVLANNGNGADFDPNGDNITVNTTPVTQPTNGTVVLTSTGGFTFTPTIPGFVGIDSFTYVICDDGVPSLCDTGIVYLNIPAGNLPPVAVTDTLNFVATNVSGNILTGTTVLGADFDSNGDNITITTTPITNPTIGTVTILPSGVATWTPTVNVTGLTGVIDSFTYRICDDGTPSLCDTGIVYITIPTVNNPPVANDDHVPYSGIGNVTVNVLVNNGHGADFDPDGDNITVGGTLVTSPTNGTVTIDSINGTVTWTPNVGVVVMPGDTVDSFDYVICDDGVPSLCDTATVYIIGTYQDCGVLTDTIDITGVDCMTGMGQVCLPILYDSIGNYMIMTDVGMMTSPTVGCALDTLAFYAIPNGNGPFAVQWNVNGTPFSATAPNIAGIVSLMNTWDALGNWTLVGDTIRANAYTNIFGYGTLVATNVASIPSIRQLNIDFNAYGSQFEVSTLAQYIVVIDTVNGCADTTYLNYTNCNYAPIAINDINLTYVNIAVSGNVLTNDFDPNGDGLIISTPTVTTTNGVTVNILPNGNYTYTPPTGFTGVDDFTYSICDASGLCDTATVTIIVLPIPSDTSNNPPVAVNDNMQTQPGVTLTSDLLNNDFDVDGDNIIINTTPVTTPTYGTVTINTDGTFDYVPNPALNGITSPVTDSFNYVICDNGTPSLCDTATAYITIIPDYNGNANDAPVAVDDVEYTTINTPVTGSVLPNDSDPNGDNITVSTTTVTTAQGVTVNINPTTGVYIYTPPTGFTGTDIFVYTICDNGIPTMCDSATVYILVEPFAGNEPPVAVNDINDTYRNIPVSGNVLPNDFDLNGDSLIVNTTPITNVANGTVTLNADGSYTYVPGFNFIGLDSFAYAICDPAGLCDTAMVYISVIDWNENDNDAPTANNDAAVTYTDVPVTGTVLNNDFDIDGDNITVSTPTVTTTNGVIVTINPITGVYTYTPP
ncbi:MAG: tandem-95 repeat protein, partial [Saprospiraceae bacterium]|nr:tandem-95 repeat protein [Saprospiraceae bacterium]